MATTDTLTGAITLQADWTLGAVGDLSTLSETSSLAHIVSLLTGVNANEINTLFHDSRSLATTVDESLNLDALTQDARYAGSMDIEFTKIRALLIINTTSTEGEDLVIDSSFANSWLGMVGNATSKIEIPSGGMYAWVDTLVGGAITAATADIIRVENQGTGTVTYDIVLMGI